MANITTYSQFKGSIYLPNTAPTYAEGTALALAITKYEHRYLKQFFGYEFYTLFQAGILATTQIYEDIRDGSTYVDTAGYTQEWEGFMTSERNPIANYIYFYHRRDIITSTDGIGEQSSAVENGSRVSPNYKMTQAWNEMVDMNKKLHDFLVANEDIYPTYQYFTTGGDDEYNQLFTKINAFGI
jgi:hypothetical protein